MEPRMIDNSSAMSPGVFGKRGSIRFGFWTQEREDGLTRSNGLTGLSCPQCEWGELKDSSHMNVKRNVAKEILVLVWSIFALFLNPAHSMQIPALPETQVAGMAVATVFGQWQVAASSQVAQPGSATLMLASSSVVLPDGTTIMPFAVGSPLLVEDSTRTETIVPSAVSCSLGSSSCSVTAVFRFSHPGHFSVTSGTFGLQEAINQQKNQGGLVLISPQWPGQTPLIEHAQGFANVQIEDLREGTTTWYGWDPVQSVYIAVSSVGAPFSGVSVQNLEGIHYADQYTTGNLSNPTFAPLVLGAQQGGSLPSGTYSVDITYFDAAGETLPSPPSAPVTISTNTGVLYVNNAASDTITGGTEGFALYISYNDGPFFRTSPSMASSALFGLAVPASKANSVDGQSGSGVSSGTHAVVPASMEGISTGTVLGIDIGQTDAELVTATSITTTPSGSGSVATGFTASFAQSHPAGFFITPLLFSQTTAVPNSGAKPPTSNTALISPLQACVNSLPAAGGTCMVPPGNFLLPSALVISHDNVRIIGSGASVTNLRVTAADDVVRAAAGGYPLGATLIRGIDLENFSVNGSADSIAHNATDTYQNGINLNYVADSTVRNVTVSNIVAQGIILQGSGNFDQAANNLVEDSRVSDFGEIGIGLEGGIFSSVVRNNFVHDGASWAPYNGSVGILVKGGGALSAYNSVASNRIWNIPADGILLQDTADHSDVGSNYIYNTGVGIRSNFNGGFNASQFLSIHDNHIVQTIDSPNSDLGPGILLNYPDTSQGHALVAGNIITNTAGYGIAVVSGADARIEQNQVENSGSGTFGQAADGIEVSGMSDVISSNTVRDAGTTASGVSGAGIRIATGASSEVVESNVSTGNAGGDIINSGTSTELQFNRLTVGPEAVNVPLDVQSLTLNGGATLPSQTVLNNDGSISGGTMTPAVLNIGSDASMTAAPRSIFSAFAPSFTTAGTVLAIWVPDRSIVVTRLEAQLQQAGVGCTSQPALNLTDGSHNVALPIVGLTSDSGAINQAISAGATVQLTLSQVPVGCTTPPANANIEIQYRMQ